MSTLFTSAAAVTSWMVFSLMIGGVVIVAALAAHDAQRAANRSVRWVWMAAIGVIVGLSLAAPLRREPASPRAALALTPTESAVSYPKMPARGVIMETALRVREAIATPVTQALNSVELYWWRLPAAFHRIVLTIWALAAVVTLGLLCGSYLRVRRRVRHWPTQNVAGVEARIAPTAGPAVVGLAPSEIVLPAWLLSRPVAEQRLVLAHETEHVRAGDPWLLVAASAAVAVMPWHPALWFAFGRLRLAVELDCDRRVLGRGVARSDYGSLLIDLSALRQTLPSAMPAFSCNGSYLERRLVAMTTGRTRFALARRIGGGVVAAVALATACNKELPTSAEVERMDVAEAQKQVSRLVLVDTATTRYKVDDQYVTKSDAEKIAAKDIASVEVTKRDGKAMDEIRITRRGRRGDSTVTMLDKVQVDTGPNVREVSVTGKMRMMADTAGRVRVQGVPLEEKRIFEGLLVIDDKIVDPTLLERINPESIDKVEVIKGDAARVRYTDPRAQKGVIKVTTKSAKP